MKKKIKRIYFDYAAATPIDPRVLRVMMPYLKENFGNTMSLHGFGQEAKQALEESREEVSGLINAKPNEIVFTGSATESNNLAVKGIALANKNKGKHIIISRIEHHCVLDSARWLEGQGFEITRIGVDKQGLINPEELRGMIRNDTILVSIIHGNNEIGTVQDISAIGKVCREERSHFEKEENRGKRLYPYFHTDAAQSAGKIEIDVNKMNIDLLTASSQKMYGPKGAALLFIREGTRIEPILHGGGHEAGMRSSTVNVPAVVGFAEAVKICKREMKREGERLTTLREKLIKGILERIEDAHLNGHPKKRLPNNANFWFSFIEGESMVIQLDMEGIAASTGSACSSSTLEPSHVLTSLGLKPQQAHGSLRLSLGRWTKDSDINYVLKVLPDVIKKLRDISPFKQR